MRITRLALAGTVAIVVASATFAAAASLGGLITHELGAGSASVTSCDGDGVTASYTVASGNVTQVTISGIAAACSGGQLRLTLANSSGTSIGTGGPVTVSATSHAVSVSPTPAAASVAGLHVVIVGP